MPNPGNPASVVNPASRRELIRVSWPQFNHDGGDLAFGPDGKLYISMGDGGSADDADGQNFTLARPQFPQMPDCSLEAPTIGHQVRWQRPEAQRAAREGPPHRRRPDRSRRASSIACPRTTRSSIRPAHWARSGLSASGTPIASRSIVKAVASTWATSARTTSRKWTSSSAAATTAGTSRRERSSSTSTATTSAPPAASRIRARMIPRGLIDPIAQYDTHHEGHSVIGGFVYHGSGIPKLRGKYVFGDFSLLFKFPRGPHDYGRLFTIDAGRRQGSPEDQPAPRASWRSSLTGGARVGSRRARGDLRARECLRRSLPGPDGRAHRARAQGSCPHRRQTTIRKTMTTTTKTDVPATRVAPAGSRILRGPAGVVPPRTMGRRNRDETGNLRVACGGRAWCRHCRIR